MVRPLDRTPRLLVFSLLLAFVGYLNAEAQFIMSPEAGAFGVYGGVIKSDLGQRALSTSPAQARYYDGFEVGIKNEFYRTDWAKGNIYVAYAQLGANEWVDLEAGTVPVTIDLQTVKFALDPLIFKAGSDFVHGYLGGGLFGAYFFDQQIEGLTSTEDYWVLGPDLAQLDYGLDLLAGVHVWNFQLELHAQFGRRELGQRADGTVAKSKFFGVSLAYMFINRNITRKNCKDTRLL